MIPVQAKPPSRFPAAAVIRPVVIRGAFRVPVKVGPAIGAFNANANAT